MSDTLFMSPRKIDDPSPHFGYITSPAGSVGLCNLTRPWVMDNGVFTNRFEPRKFVRYLGRARPYREWCKFVVAPDVVGDAQATDRQYPHWRDLIRHMGFPVAYAAQDGCVEIPDCDALFIGGTTEWKLGGEAARLISQAKERGIWVHVGRVNTRGRLNYCRVLGVDSVDGTCLAIAPTVHIRKLNRWFRQGVLSLPAA